MPTTVVAITVAIGALLDYQHERNGPAHWDVYTTTAEAAAAPTTRDATEMVAWLTRTAPSVMALRDAFNDVSDAALAGDFADTNRACHTGLVSLAALQHELPSPDARVDTSLRQALTDYDEALRLCIRGTEYPDADAFAKSVDLVAAGNDHWRESTSLLDEPWPFDPPGDGRRHLFLT